MRAAPAGPVGPADLSRAVRQLRALAIVGLVDAALVISLLIGLLVDTGAPMSVLGSLHGVGFVSELYLAARGAGERWWGWWYVAAIGLTGGPLGLAFGHVRARRQMRGGLQRPGPAPPGQSSEAVAEPGSGR